MGRLAAKQGGPLFLSPHFRSLNSGVAPAENWFANDLAALIYGLRFDPAVGIAVSYIHATDGERFYSNERITGTTLAFFAAWQSPYHRPLLAISEFRGRSALGESGHWHQVRNRTLRA